MEPAVTQSRETDALVFDVSPYMIEDGPGIRTTVFFKGCPLRCSWCSNPFGLSPRAEIAYNQGRCISCGACIAACAQGALQLAGESIAMDRGKCTVCGSCVDVCLSNARILTGRTCSARDIATRVMRDSQFYRRDGGGVTLSGGEVLLQPSAATEILDLCRSEFIHSAVETSGYGPWPALRSLLERCDLIFVDIKHASDQAHRRLTGVGNRLIMENITRTAQHVQEHGTPRFVLRLPVIPGLNTDPENMQRTADFIAGLPGRPEVNLLPYHQLGVTKYEMLDMVYGASDVPVPSPTLLRKYEGILRTSLPECGCSSGGWQIDRTVSAVRAAAVKP